MASVYLVDEVEHLAKQLAKKKFNGNLSGYIQSLVKDDYDKMKQTEERNNNQLKMFLYQFILYSFMGISLLFLAITSVSGMYQIISFLLLLTTGVLLVGYSVMIYHFRYKKEIKEVSI